MFIDIYTNNLRFNMHCNEYKMIWLLEGEKIQKAFSKIIGLEFKEDVIKLLINEGLNGSNSAGDSVTSIMNFRYNNRCKIGTFLHELSHRIALEYNMFEISQQLYGFVEIHELLDLFLYDVIKELYGQEAADLRVEYESGFQEPEYARGCEKTLKLTFEERQNLLKKIVEVIKNEK